MALTNYSINNMSLQDVLIIIDNASISGISDQDLSAAEARQSAIFVTNSTTTTVITDQANSPASITSTSTGLSGSTPFIGSFLSTSGFSVGNIHQVIIVPGTLTSGQQTFLLNFISQKLITVT